MKNRFISFLAAVLAVLLLASSQALAEKRIALVIGNSAYTVGRLANPSNDARLIAKTLRSLDFEVLEHTDLNQPAMKKAIVDFGDILDRAGEDAVGLFFYAGHGIQADGQNYLVPLGVELNRKSHLKVYAVEANWVLAQMEEAGNAMNLVILDACRNNPFTRGWKRSQSSGLARMEAPRGTMIAYATRPGDVAADGRGNNSPYTAALSKSMVKPGVSLSDMFIEVRNTVMAATNENQVPWEEGGLTSKFYFNPSSSVASSTQPALQPVMSEASVAWQTIQNSTNPEEIEAFILAFRSNPLAGIARAKLKVLKEKPKQTAMVVPPKPSPPPSQAKPAVGVFPKKPGDTFRDCRDCPEMVVVPAGSFLMGSIPAEREWLVKQGIKRKWVDMEIPRHGVRIGKAFAVGRYEVTRGQYASFAREIGRGTGDGCNIVTGGKLEKILSKNWKDPGYKQTDRDPVTCVSWDDAKAYTQWLSRKTGKSYRLLTEAEWEYSARAGTDTMRYWGGIWGNEDGCRYANVADEGSGSGQPHFSCADGSKYTSPVGKYRPNQFGLYDMLGNVSEWVEDCWHDNYNGAPRDGNAWTSGGDCFGRVLRGGFWASRPVSLRSADRSGSATVFRGFGEGFRVARDLQ